MAEKRTTMRAGTWGFASVVVVLLIGVNAGRAESPGATGLGAGAAGGTSAQVDTGSTAWMLMSSALVFLMVPGLALFYGGMVRAKNALNMLMCCFVSVGVIGLQWVIVGYCLAFSGVSALRTAGGWSFLGWDPSLLFLKAFGAADYGRFMASGDTTGAVATKVPELAFVMFQGKFAIITPALIVGALAERIRFGPFVVFMLLWSTLVYDPVAHWVWNTNGWLFRYGVLDFAGGTEVHLLSGVSALALCLIVGPRKGYRKEAMSPHSVLLTIVGAGLLWFGWFGFNAGSAIAVPAGELPVCGRVAALAFTNTQIAAAAAATAWMVVEWMVTGRPTVLGFASGMVAGLVVITPCAGHVVPWHSMIIGGLGGVACFYGCRIKNLVKSFDDSLDTFGVHGVGGALGALLVGIFAFQPVSGGMSQLVKQLVGIVCAGAYAFGGTLLIGWTIHKVIGLRVSEEVEDDGLDIRVHGERAYQLT